jgi:hypothetical protein
MSEPYEAWRTQGEPVLRDRTELQDPTGGGLATVSAEIETQRFEASHPPHVDEARAMQVCRCFVDRF